MRRWQTALWASAIASAIVAAWLFLPGAAARGAPLRAVLVDVSASVARAPAWLPWVRAELERVAGEAQRAHAELAVLAYADGVASVFGPGEPARLRAALAGADGTPLDPRAGLADGATELAAALEALEALLGASKASDGSVVLLAPPAATGASPAGALARLRDAGVAFETRVPPDAALPDVGVLALTCAPRIEGGAPLVAALRLVVHGPVASPVRLAFELADAEGTRTFEREMVALSEGELELPVDCGPVAAGRVELRVRIAGTDADHFPENDRAATSTLAGDVRALGVVADAALRTAAETWCAPRDRNALDGLALHVLAPEQLPAALGELDAVVGFDAELDAATAELLASFVRRGGGWLALSGWRFLRAWVPGAVEGALLELLPTAPAGDAPPPRDVLLLVDGSGSMEGEPFESVRAAALELVSAALPADRVSVRFFTDALEPEHVLKQRSTDPAGADDARRAARDLLALRVPSGTTFLLRALAELHAVLGAEESLVFLLSDGREREDPVGAPERARRIAAELAAARARLVVIAAGEPDLALLGALAGGVEHVRSARAPGDLAELFVRELHRARVAEGELALHRAARASGSLAAEVEALDALADGTPEPAPLERSLRSRLRAGGEALWTSAAGEPVLAVARAGAGRTAHFGSLPIDGWAARYAAAGAPAFAGLLRWLARGPETAPLPRARSEGRRLWVAGLDATTPAVLAARLTDPSRGAPARTLQLFPPDGPGSDPFRTRVAELAEDPGAGALLWFEPHPGAEEIGIALERALPDEFAWREVAVDPRSLASAGGAAPVFGTKGSSRPAAPFALALALGLLLAAGLSATRVKERRPSADRRGPGAKGMPSCGYPP